MNETQEKKVIGRNVAVTFGVICIILITSLSGAIAYHIAIANSMDARYNDYVSDHTHSDSQVDYLLSEIARLRNQVGNLTEIVELRKSSSVSWLGEYHINLPATLSPHAQHIGEYIISMDPPFGQYPGICYVEVSSASDIFVNVTYSSRGFEYNSQTDVGMNGTVVFPVLPIFYPWEDIVIRIGTHNITTTATAHLIITYIY